MLNEQTIERNPKMVQAAIDLHQYGMIPVPCHLIDLDAVRLNAKRIVDAAEIAGVNVLGMMKQDAHNPFMTQVAFDAGFAGFSAVEAMQAWRTHHYGFPIGQVGHLSQIPTHDIPAILAMEPAAITVYTVEHARRISDVARLTGRRQRVYISVSRRGDSGRFDDMTGGWTLENCVAAGRALLDLDGIELAGLVDHVSIDYATQDDPANFQPTQALETTVRAKELLEKELGISLGINIAGNANALTIGRLAKDYGATEVEPGAALTGSARFHALGTGAEIPAHTFVSEVTHEMYEHAYAIGGGIASLWRLGAPDEYRGMVGCSFDEAVTNQFVIDKPALIDFNVPLFRNQRQTRPGQTLVFPHMSQHFTERGYTAAVRGIQSGHPFVVGLCDNNGTILDPETRYPVSLDEARESLAKLTKHYLLMG